MTLLQDPLGTSEMYNLWEKIKLKGENKNSQNTSEA